jgi:hypothetical protein
MRKYKLGPSRLQLLSLASLVVVVLPVFLSGCSSAKYSTNKTDSKKKDAGAYCELFDYVDGPLARQTLSASRRNLSALETSMEADTPPALFSPETRN